MEKRGQKGAFGAIMIVIGLIFLFAIVFSYWGEMRTALAKVLPKSETPDIGTNGPDQATVAYRIIVTWLGFGETWALIISSFMVLLIIVSGTYDILMGFSLFSIKEVKLLIAFGIGVIAAVSGFVRTIALFFFTIAAGLGAVSIAFGIFVPFFIFFVMNLLFYRIFKELSTKKTMVDIESGATTAKTALRGLGDVAQGMKEAGQKIK